MTPAADMPGDGLSAPGKIACAFRTTGEDVARTVGLGKDAVQRDRMRSDKTQAAGCAKWSIVMHASLLLSGDGPAVRLSRRGRGPDARTELPAGRLSEDDQGRCRPVSGTQG